MGPGDDGNAPAAVAQTRRPGSRGRGADQHLVALVVSGGPRAQAQSDRISLCAPDLAGLVRSIGSQTAPWTSREGKPQGLAGCRAPGRAYPTDVECSRLA